MIKSILIILFQTFDIINSQSLFLKNVLNIYFKLLTFGYFIFIKIMIIFITIIIISDIFNILCKWFILIIIISTITQHV